MADADLTLVTDRRRLAGRSLPSLAADAARAGVEWIQVREKDLQARALLRLVEEIAGVLAGTRARLMVNGRPDVAEAGGADGVQLPEDGLPVGAVKKAFPGLVVSASRHTVEGARRAEDEGADILLIGPVFPTPGKPAALGIEGFEEIAAIRLDPGPCHRRHGAGHGAAGGRCRGRGPGRDSRVSHGAAGGDRPRLPGLPPMRAGW